MLSSPEDLTATAIKVTEHMIAEHIRDAFKRYKKSGDQRQREWILLATAIAAQKCRRTLEKCGPEEFAKLYLYRKEKEEEFFKKGQICFKPGQQEPLDIKEPCLVYSDAYFEGWAVAAHEDYERKSKRRKP